MSVGDEIARAFGRLIETRLDVETLRAAEAGAFPDALFRETLELGLADALVPESRGGFGLRWRDLAPLFRAAGAAALPVPIGEHMLARMLIAEAGAPAPDGLIALPARPGAPLTVSRAGVSGALAAVPWGGAASHLVAEGVRDGTAQTLLLARADVVGRPTPSLSREPYETLTLEAVAPAAAGPGEAGRLLHLGAALRSLQIAGALEKVLALCVDYAQTRRQFGRPIGKFQAVQQMLAELSNEAAAVNAVTDAAVAALDRGRADAATAVAKARASAAADKASALAHEVFAAIGVTEELGLHHLTRRLWQWRDDFGDEAYWADRLGRDLLASPDRDLWARVVGAFDASA
ncbi:MAG: acyl-CoA dehydrogenase family protein [Alphaproteobacteria bacterium]|nr:acyl-CoA dehydrogenase family protein [Alphaproteobacteria bacterium]